MPSTLEAMHAFIDSGIAFGPAKAANAGGVSVSQLEMAQNASMQRWTFERVDNQLRHIMYDIHHNAAATAASACSATSPRFSAGSTPLTICATATRMP